MIAPFIGDWTNPAEMAARHSDVHFVSSFSRSRFSPKPTGCHSILPEAEPELVGGYHTEYSSMKFASLFPRRIRRDDHRLGDHRHAFPRRLASADSVVARSVSLGAHRWLGSRLARNRWRPVQHRDLLRQSRALLFFFIWVRWTLPRFRYDQLMRLGWVFFFEIALVNIFIAAHHPRLLSNFLNMAITVLAPKTDLVRAALSARDRRRYGRSPFAISKT